MHPRHHSATHCGRARNARRLALCLGILAGAQYAVAQSRSFWFDIPAQPLDQALDAFGAVTGVQVFYEAATTASMTSNALKGSFEVNAALTLMLEGSNLQARMLAPNTITVEAPDLSGPAMREAKQISVAYYGAMQATVLRALCHFNSTRPGSYRIAFQYWVGATGRVARFKVLVSSGDGNRDNEVERAVRSAIFDAGVGKLPQPITFAVVPAGDETPACGPAAAAPGPVH